MHRRQAAKIAALEALGSGVRDYRTFNAAASFGHLTDKDFQRINGYRPGLDWVQANSSNPNAYAKDHMGSRSFAFHNHYLVQDMLSLKLVCALMQHAANYELGKMPQDNNSLWLMAVVTGHPANAEVLSVKQNSRKGAACSQTPAQLKHAIINWECKL